jgi:hypothetical protein
VLFDEAIEFADGFGVLFRSAPCAVLGAGGVDLLEV